MVNLEWYRTFKAIYQYGTLTRAAQELMISQPSMSIQLAALENYIGQTLFVRLPRKMMPTEYGKQLYNQVVEPIDILEKVETKFKRSALNKMPTIRLGVPAELFNNYLAHNIGHEAALQLTVEYGLSDDFTRKIADNDLDIAIITRQMKTDDAITYEPLFTESFMIVCNPNMDTEVFEKHIANEDFTQAERWLKDQKWYAYNNSLPLIKRFWRENFKKRPVLKLSAVIPDNNAILKAISNSDGLGVSSDLIAKFSMEKKQVKVLWDGHTPATNTIYLAYNKNKIQPLHIEAVRTFLKKHIN